MGNLKERTVWWLRGILWLILMSGLTTIISLGLLSALSCSLHVHLKDNHYYGTEQPKEEKAAELIEGIFENAEENKK